MGKNICYLCHKKMPVKKGIILYDKKWYHIVCWYSKNDQDKKERKRFTKNLVSNIDA